MVDWLALGGTELINTVRAAKYSDALNITPVLCGPCEGFQRAVQDPPYTTPGEDKAPWFDPAVPASGLFAGFAGLRIEGMAKGTGGRSRSELLRDGAAVGQLRRRSREIVVQVEMYAKTEEAYAYGLAWLTSAVEGPTWPGACVAEELCFFAWCPVCPEPAPVPDTCGDDALRIMYDVGLLEGPTELERHQVVGGWKGTVEFTLVAGRPGMWRQPLYITGTGHPGLLPAPPIGPPENCEPEPDCAADPDCPPYPEPIRPPAPADPCFPGPPPANDTYRRIATVPAGQLPSWFESVPILQIRTGELNLRRLTVRFYNNPSQWPCTEYIDPCSACTEINIPYLPKGSIFRLDGRVERATVDCPGGLGDDLQDVEPYGPGGDMFDWPRFDCSISLCVEIIAQASTVASDMRIDLWMVSREDAA